jgi:hypothetical protein
MVEARAEFDGGAGAPGLGTSRAAPSERSPARQSVRELLGVGDQLATSALQAREKMSPASHGGGL